MQNVKAQGGAAALRFILWAALAVLASTSGCTSGSLMDYAPLGAGRQDIDIGHNLINILSDELPQEEMWPGFQLFEREYAGRVDKPSFRTLCSILSRRFPKWNRLLILERVFGPANDDRYDYVLLADTPSGNIGVTSIRPGDEWGDAKGEAFAVGPNADRIQGIWKRLDSLEDKLPHVLLWSGAMDAPYYVLHYIRPNLPPFSFAVCGFNDSDEPTRPTTGIQTGDPKTVGAIASRLLDAHAPASPEEFGVVAGMYRLLLADAWDAALHKVR